MIWTVIKDSSSLFMLLYAINLPVNADVNEPVLLNLAH